MRPAIDRRGQDLWGPLSNAPVAQSDLGGLSMSPRIALVVLSWMAILHLATPGMVNARPAPSATAEKEVVRGTNRFAWRMYAFQCKEDPRADSFLSPYSLYAAFAMMHEGARGSTAGQLARVFGFPPTGSAGMLGQGLQTLTATLESRASRGRYDLSVANTLWVSKKCRLLPKYMQLIAGIYQATCRQVDFSKPEEVRQQINAKIAEQTRQRIRDIIPPRVLQPTTPLVLANAIYFKSTWAAPFQKGRTSSQPFFLDSGKNRQVQLMMRTGTHNYFEAPDLQVLALPYKGNDLSMLIFLPSRRSGLKKLEATLNADRVEDWLRRLAPREVAVWLPRFKLEHGFLLDLPRATALGMPLPFSPEGDFSGMAPKGAVRIGLVLHKAFIEVDEQGTEAAAATIIVGAPRGAAPPPVRRVVFRADHPFVFAIRDNSSGALLFVGRLTGN